MIIPVSPRAAPETLPRKYIQFRNMIVRLPMNIAKVVQEADISSSESMVVGQFVLPRSMSTRKGAVSITTSAERTALGKCRNPLVR